MSNLNKVAIKLFKSVIVNDKNNIEWDAAVLAKGIYIPELTDSTIAAYAVNKYGINSGLFNATFHKDWNKVEKAPIEQLFLEQIFHYMTTYGTNFESSYVFIPAEELNIPEIDVDKIKITVIQPITKAEFVEKIRSLVSSGIALSTSVVEDIVSIWNELYISINDVKNRELLIALCSKLGLVPCDANTLLRVALCIKTGSTLKIKNKSVFNLLKRESPQDSHKIEKLFTDYVVKYGYTPLVNIFKPNKDLFVCLKSESTPKLNAIINKISKGAKKLPTKEVKVPVINQITNPHVELSVQDIEAALDKVPAFKEIALLNVLKYLTQSTNEDDIIYTIRNGKTFVKPMKEYSIHEMVSLVERFEIIEEHLRKRVRKNIENKVFYIPKNVEYMMPTSEKQFVEHIPSGSYIEFDKKNTENVIIAIAWETECDLDASLINEDGKIGWDSVYRDEEQKIYFSGDMTRLDSNGQACEAHLIKGSYNGRYSVNLYSNRSEKAEIPFKIIVSATEKVSSINRHERDRMSSAYAIDPNEIVATFNKSINSNETRQLYICNISITEDKVRLTFTNENAGSNITARWTDYDTRKLNVLKRKADLQLTLAEFIESCGGMVVHTDKIVLNEVTIPIKVDYDFSLENISKEKILEIFS